MRKLASILFAGASLVSLATPALAQDNGAPVDQSAKEGEDESELVVTGTLIRGTAATGSQTISVDANAIEAVGANSTNQVLALIPQLSNTFNGRFEGDPRGYSAGISINKPNLRNLPSANTSSSATTLVLVDGSRVTPVGVNQAAIDVDIIPAAVLAGVDVVTDGGSSLYGADAVAGVINFRTLRRFDGIKADGNFGFGTTIDGFSQWDASITAGKSWSTGSAYISVGHSERDGILNGQVPWVSGLVYNTAGVGTFNYTQCAAPVGTETRWFRFGAGAAQFTNNPAAPGAGVFPVGTPCDAVSSQSYVPRQKRSNVYASFSQDVADNIDLRVTAYWTKRDTALFDYPRGFTSAGSPITTGAQVGALFPGAAVGSITVIPGGTGFSFAPNAAYVHRPTRIGFETWGITPELTIELGGAWELRNTVHFGRSSNYQRFPGVNAVLAQGYINGGQLNPLNVAAASGTVVSDILDYENAQDTDHQLFLFRSVADGPLFALPGGDAKLAVGVEYQDNSANSKLVAGRVDSLDALPFMKASRNAKSAFAELSLPITRFLDVSGSVRYDNYSDFGSTTNPNIGIALKPFAGLKIFGHWNTSFNAPTALDGLAIATGRYVCGIYVPGGTASQRPTDPLGRDTSKQGSCAFVMQGSKPNLQPQTAESWAAGFEANPIEGFRFGGEFYSIDFKNVLGSLNPSNLSTYVTNADLYTYNITQPQFDAILATLTNGAALSVQQPASNIAIVVDTRTTNLNAAKLEGVDFHVNYDTDTSFGHLALGVNGTVQTKARITANGATTNELGHGNPRFTATSFVAWNKGRVSARVTVNYSGKFHDIATNNVGVSETVSPFIVTNVNLGYDFGDSGGPLSGTSFRVAVDNLFEETPQTIKRTNTNNPSYNNWTLGRVIKLGISKKF